MQVKQKTTGRVNEALKKNGVKYFLNSEVIFKVNFLS